VPHQAAGFASQLRHMLGEPEMIALLQASAQARRVLTPLCRMLGIEAELLQAPGPEDEAAVVVSTSPVALGALEGGDAADERKRPADVQLYRLWWDGD